MWVLTWWGGYKLSQKGSSNNLKNITKHKKTNSRAQSQASVSKKDFKYLGVQIDPLWMSLLLGNIQIMTQFLQSGRKKQEPSISQSTEGRTPTWKKGCIFLCEKEEYLLSLLFLFYFMSLVSFSFRDDQFFSARSLLERAKKIGNFSHKLFLGVRKKTWGRPPPASHRINGKRF